MKKIKIIDIKYGEINEAIDSVAEESTINIFANKKLAGRVQCSPEDEEKLVYGFLFTERIINSINDVKRIYFETQHGEKNFYADIEKETMEVLPLSREIEIPANNLFNLMGTLFEKGTIFRRTGGTYISGLSDGERLLSVFEDISGKSALQKAIGNALLERTMHNSPLLLTSAGINETAIHYVKRAGIKIVASHSAPTDRAVEKAESSRITLIGFLRENRMNIYSAPHRIIF